MSERRNVQSALRSATDILEQAIEALNDAEYYLWTYDFLQEANPTLLAEIATDKSVLAGIAKRCWNTEVAA